VLICFAFPAIIPPGMLGGFAKGGVNLHPALLPHYRGPHPFHRLVVDGQHAIHGGVTLHKMSEAFDEGDILAQVPFSEAAWRSKPIFVDAVATALRMLVSEAVPAYCAGVLAGVPQPAGAFVWARLDSAHMLIQPASSIEHVARLWRVLGIVPGMYLKVGGQTVRLAFRIRRLGPPTGTAPVRRWGTVAFDLADGRVLHLTYNRLIKRLVNTRSMFRRPPAGAPQLTMKLFGTAPNAGKDI
jgi:methionyl-tRNA formyltransferase